MTTQTPQTDDQTQNDQNAQAAPVQGNPEAKETPEQPVRDDGLVAALKSIDKQADDNYQTTENLLEDTEKLLGDDQQIEPTSPANSEPNN